MAAKMVVKIYTRGRELKRKELKHARKKMSFDIKEMENLKFEID
jgi:exonuclease VII small subunit